MPRFAAIRLPMTDIDGPYNKTKWPKLDSHNQIRLPMTDRDEPYKKTKWPKLDSQNSWFFVITNIKVGIKVTTSLMT
jgi:hypothetical protein